MSSIARHFASFSLFTVAGAAALATMTGCAVSATEPGTDGESVATAASAWSYCQPFIAAQLEDYADASGYWNIDDKTGNFWTNLKTKDLADRFIAVAKSYGFGQLCQASTNNGNLPIMSYMLMPQGTVAQTGSIAGEVCTSFDPTQMKVAWDSTAHANMLKAGAVTLSQPWFDNAAIAEMQSTITARGFVARCVYGDINSVFHVEYWKGAGMLVTPHGSAPIPIGPAPAAPTLCSAATGCNDAAVASCRIAPAGPLYYVKNGSTPYALETTAGVAKFAWSEWNKGVASETVSVCAKTTGGEACAPAQTIYFQHQSCNPILPIGGGQ